MHAPPPARRPLKVGVLALQGDVGAHSMMLRRLGAADDEVRRCGQLDGLDGLVLPGGESSTLLNLMRDEPWFEALRSFHARGGSLFGTCAGAILLSRDVCIRTRLRVGGCTPSQPSLGFLGARIERNGYGRQVQSFEEPVAVQGLVTPVTAVFIRAPRFLELDPEVEILARRAGEPVLVRQGRVLAATFHPELTEDNRVHALFLAGMRPNLTRSNQHALQGSDKVVADRR